jgi:hypothetical protein
MMTLEQLGGSRDMLTHETLVKLTVDGKLEAWQQGVQSFESAIREMSNGLVVAASALSEYRSVDGAEEWGTELARQWWEDIDQLPMAARKLTLTRMICAGIPEPVPYTLEEV